MGRPANKVFLYDEKGTSLTGLDNSYFRKSGKLTHTGIRIIIKPYNH